VKAFWLRINYGLNRKHKRKFEHLYGKIRCVGSWECDETHNKIRTLIRRRHPGWNITGYALIYQGPK
jgi:hypothetical protein